MNQCPECDLALSTYATECPKCKWKKPAEAKPVDMESARKSALADIYAREIRGKQPEALEFCRQQGLNTVDQMREWVKGNSRLKTFGKEE
jgi:hypothetical protein